MSTNVEGTAEGTPVVVRNEDQIIINVPKSDVRVPVRPEIVTHVYVAATRRDVLLGIIAGALLGDLILRLVGG